MTDTTVLITGGGAPGIAGTIYALRNNPEDVSFKIITTDINDDVVGKYLADKFHQLPPPEDEQYIPILQEIARKEKVGVVIPQTTREIAVLSKNVEKFANSGVAITVSSSESIRITNDKFLLLEKAKQIKVPYPTYYLTDSESALIEAVNSFGYPEKKVVVKPRTSSGMRGLRVLVEESWNVQRFLSEKPEGVEISLSALSDILHRGNWHIFALQPFAGKVTFLEWLTDVNLARCAAFVNPYDPNDITHRILYLLDNPDKARQLGERGRRLTAEKYNWETESQKLIGLYGKLLK